MTPRPRVWWQVTGLAVIAEDPITAQVELNGRARSMLAARYRPPRMARI